MRPGRPVVLPTTFARSARHMAQEYKDAIAIVRKKGKGNGLNYVLTMPANSERNEITSGSGRKGAVEAIRDFIPQPPGCRQGTSLAPVAWHNCPAAKEGALRA